MHGLSRSAQMHIAPAPAPDRAQEKRYCRHIARLAVRSLYQELTLYPKPGLVSLVDNGSHADMTAGTFMRSLFALRHYFYLVARAGMRGAAFAQLQQLGVQAEARMLVATGGVNTHRGAIFALGMLCAAIGYCHGQRMALSAASLRAVLLNRWGDALTRHTLPDATLPSHGLQVASAHAVGGAREEGALGFPSVFEVALPRMAASLAQGGSDHDARIDALFALMAQLSDTNVYHRGGAAGAELVRQRSAAFLAAGGTAHHAWRVHALDCHREFIERRLSPGGAADLLAAACLVRQACAMDETAS